MTISIQPPLSTCVDLFPLSMCLVPHIERGNKPGDEGHAELSDNSNDRHQRARLKPFLAASIHELEF